MGGRPIAIIRGVPKETKVFTHWWPAPVEKDRRISLGWDFQSFGATAEKTLY